MSSPNEFLIVRSPDLGTISTRYALGTSHHLQTYKSPQTLLDLMIAEDLGLESLAETLRLRGSQKHLQPGRLKIRRQWRTSWKKGAKGLSISSKIFLEECRSRTMFYTRLRSSNFRVSFTKGALLSGS